MLNENTLKNYDDHLTDYERREMNGTLTKEEKLEAEALKADKAAVAEIFRKAKV